jgi:alpha-glucosidase
MLEAIGLEGEILLSTLMDRTGEKISASLDLREGVITEAAPRPLATAAA